MSGIELAYPNFEKTNIILNEAVESEKAMTCTYKCGLYKATIKLAYDSMLFVGEAFAAYKGFEIRKRDCHLQISNLFKEHKEEIKLSISVIDVFEEIRPTRNMLVHIENYCDEIKDGNEYEELAKKSVHAANTMLKSFNAFLKEKSNETI